MKKKIISTMIIVSMLIIPLMSVAETEPGNPGGEPGGETPIGGSAPIGGGTFMLIALGAAYGGKKVYDMNKEELED
jgi:hypothetical protein